ncbi:hypothetical protein BIW11_12106 [Tropilaelaps mercedesae]|uniref:K Homology domain-containing protein n=1 Tax=Tropilaelaps mercedesae TaxID=418985 RepID=A0A1V9X804_9ACAR|nr:hypothetical protein BIW11_12106 [Tropilaelaps mercedesae]
MVEHCKLFRSMEKRVELIGIPRRLFDQLINDDKLVEEVKFSLKSHSGAAEIEIKVRQRNGLPGNISNPNSFRNQTTPNQDGHRARRPTDTSLVRKNNPASVVDFYRRFLSSSVSTDGIAWPELSSRSPLPLKKEHLTTDESLGSNRYEFFFQVTGTPYEIDFVRAEISRMVRHKTTSENWVTLKMDVSFLDHSFMIGRWGKGIRRVVRDTGCQIHFPDSNKNDYSEKSNQVSVSGPPGAVVTARQRVRELLPISLGFFVDKDDYQNAIVCTEQLSDRAVPELKPEVKHTFQILQNQFHITITWLPIVNARCAMVTVRGARSNITRIQEGIHVLNTYLRPGKPPPDAQLCIAVSTQHLQFVFGENDAKVRAIMKMTNTRFALTAGRSNTSQHITTVRFFGLVENIYDAWRAFMDLLPAVVLIELPDSTDSGRERRSMNQRHGNSSMENARGIPVESLTQAQTANLCMATRDRLLALERCRHKQYITVEELQALTSLGVLSSDVLTSSVAVVKPNGDIEIVDPGLHRAIALAAAFTVLLYSFEILLTVRSSRDLKNWKLEARGPESRLGLIMEVHNILRNPHHNAVVALRETVQSWTSFKPTWWFKSPYHEFDQLSAQLDPSPTLFSRRAAVLRCTAPPGDSVSPAFGGYGFADSNCEPNTNTNSHRLGSSEFNSVIRSVGGVLSSLSYEDGSIGGCAELSSRI